MKEQQFSFHSFQDHLEIKGTLMIPDKAIGILQIVHGMSEHRYRYLPFMRYMADKGWICVIHDHRGHGESVKNENDLGYFYDDSGTYLVEDTHQVTYYMKKQFPKLPYVLLGHSMGSLAARAYAKKYDYELDALIVCGSPSKHTLLPLASLLVFVIEKWKGDHYRSPWIQRIAFGSFGRRFHNTPNENCWICSDDAVVKQYDADEKCGFIFTTNGFRSLWKLMRNVYDKDDWILLNTQLPILFIAGADDPCITDANHFAQAYNFMRKLGYQNVSAKLYPKLRHEILNEKGKEQVYEDIASFVETHTKDIHRDPVMEKLRQLNE